MPKMMLDLDLVTLERKLRKVADEKKDLAKAGVYAAGDVFEAEAIQHAPRKTGELIDNIVAEKKTGHQGPEVRVGTSAHHGGFQEFGTKHNRPHPFIRPALRIAVSYLRVRFR